MVPNDPLSTKRLILIDGELVEFQVDVFNFLLEKKGFQDLLAKSEQLLEITSNNPEAIQLGIDVLL
jgi:hypothetical protein